MPPIHPHIAFFACGTRAFLKKCFIYVAGFHITGKTHLPSPLKLTLPMGGAGSSWFKTRPLPLVSTYSVNTRWVPTVTARGGFTLIELLSVIAVIAILSTLLFPVISGIRVKHKQAVCANNMRQIAQAMLAYANSGDGHLPAGIDMAATEAEGKQWDAKLRPFLGVDIATNGRATHPSEVLYSPSDPRPLRLNPEQRQWARSYALPRANSESSWAQGIGVTYQASEGVYASRHLADFAFPSRTVMLVQLYGERNYQFGGAYTVMDVWTVNGGNGAAVKPNGRHFHGDTNNFAFVDGHIEALPTSEINTTRLNRFRAF